MIPQCGTYLGYRRHLADMENACPDCRAAGRRQSARYRYTAATGRTPEAAFYADVHARAMETVAARRRGAA